MASTINFHERYPIVDVDRNRILANNGNIAYAYRVVLPEIHSLSEKDFEKLHGHWFQALKSLPVGTLVHKQDIYRKTTYDAHELANDTFLQRATREHFMGREHLTHESLIFFVWPKNRAINDSALVNPFATISKKLPEALEEQAEGFGKAVGDAVTFLNNDPKLILEPFNQTRVIQYTDAYFNGFNEGFDTDMVLEKDRVQVGNHYFEVMAVNNESCFGDVVQTSVPNEQYAKDGFWFHQGFIDGLGLTFQGNHIVNQIIHLDDRHKWRKQLEKRLEELSKSSNFGSQNKVLYDRVSDTLSKLNQDDASLIIRGQLNVVCWSKNEKKLEQSISELTARFKELDIRPYCPQGKARIHYVLNSYPLFSSNFSDTDLYVTDLKHALCLWINATNYRCDKQGIIFNDRLDNIPVMKDVWDEEKRRIKARNFAIFAPTGEGKSFLANNILRQYFEQDVRLVIIDLGGSYAKFAQLYPDQHIILKYEPGKNLGINPFYKTPGEAVTAEWLEDLTNFLIELYVPGERSNKAQEVALKKILRSYYERVKEGHSLDAYIDVGLDSKNEYRIRIGQSKVPFGFENMQSSSNRLPLDRDDALNSAVKDERDLGVFFYWATKEKRQLIKELRKAGLSGGDFGLIALGFYNGQTANHFDQNNEFHVVSRFSYPLELGHQVIEPGIQAYTGKYVVTEHSSSIAVDTEGYLDQRAAVSFVLYPRPFGIQAEYNVGKGPEYDKATNTIQVKPLQGGYATFSYYVEKWGQKFYPFVRLQYYDGGKKHELDARSYDVHDAEIGLEWHPFPHFEFLAEYTYSDRRYEDFTNTANHQKGSLFRVQAQLKF